ncbi:PAS domain-containing protein [Bernardetia sp.]|uniref:PAS domain-containing protein n=1 Tax=Bernardetia sp. TaxID=1937974 RepID=UPI0025BF0454|nr:PAS domain-containing protein [Bernardetia sp.]
MNDNLSDMMCLDVYLSLLKSSKNTINASIFEQSKLSVFPLLSRDVFSLMHQEAILSQNVDIDKVKSFAKKFKWKNNFEEIFSANDFEAIIITDVLEKIMWVNNGFTKMTGYSRKFATGKHPNFLQGNRTSNKTKANIQNRLREGQPFETSIINYKKDKTPYKCKIKIFPLYTDSITHFMALEQQIK